MKRNRMQNSLLLRYGFCIFIIFLILWFQGYETVMAGTTHTITLADGSQVICTASNDAIYYVTFTKEGELKIVGKHTASSSTIAYQTVGFTFTSKPANGKITAYMGSGKQYYSLRYDGNPGKYVTDVRKDDYIETTYTFPKHIIDQVLREFGYTEEDLSKRGVTIYLSNIFRVIRKTGYSYVYDDNMVHFDCNAMRAARAWSASTMEKIPHYYDMQINLRKQGFEYQILGVDENNKVVSILEDNIPAVQNNRYTVTYPKEIKKGEKIFVFAERYSISYNNGVDQPKFQLWPSKAENKIPFVYQEAANAKVKLLYKIKEKEEGKEEGKEEEKEEGKEEEKEDGKEDGKEEENENEEEIPFVLPDIRPENEEWIEEKLGEAKVEGVLLAEEKGRERYDIDQGIPSSEKLYANVRASEYLLGYRFAKRTGVKEYPVKVKKRYHLEWKEKIEADKPGGKVQYEEKRKTIEVIKTEVLKRSYAYWEIEYLDWYQLSNSVIYNEVLPEGKISMVANELFLPNPKLIFEHNSDLKYHLEDPDLYLEASEKTIVGGLKEPKVEHLSLRKEAEELFGEIKVRNDKLDFKGKTVLSDQWVETSTSRPNLEYLVPSELCSENLLFRGDLMIPMKQANGEYPTRGSVVYERIASINSMHSENISFLIPNLKKVRVHTPIVCSPTIVADKKKFVQKVEPDLSHIPLVLDERGFLSRFTVNISNAGQHRQIKGYGNRNYEYILRNEVKFPFDVILDYGEDGYKNNDQFIIKNTWIEIKKETTFYLPIWVNEKKYQVDFRSIAINADDKEERIEKAEKQANLNLSNYVANEKLFVEVSGRVLGLQIYKVNGVEWKEVKPYQAIFTSGVRNEYGELRKESQKQFPLVAGDHPLYKNLGMLKKGYSIQFYVDTIGDYENLASYIEIKPKFYFLDSKTEERKEVDVYYHEVMQGKKREFVQVGSALDKINLKFYSIRENRLHIEEKKLKQLAAFFSISYPDLLKMKVALFTFSELRLQAPFRIFNNEAYFDALNFGIREAALSVGITKEDVTARRQRWFGEYYLPSELFITEKGRNVAEYQEKMGLKETEDFWLKEGYLIVNFELIVRNQDGNPSLDYGNVKNYLNYGHCSMWLLEGALKEKQDQFQKKFFLHAGDFLIYDLRYSALDDYKESITH